MPTKDAIWDVFSGAGTIEEFQAKILRPIFLKPEVPNIIKESVPVIEKLLLYSFYEYDFIEVAITQAIFLLEKAMKIRWRDIHNEGWKYNFKRLIDWFYKNGYFEVYGDRFIHQLRDIRNHKVHEEGTSKGGIVFIEKTYSIFDLINDLYEDVGLRLARKRELEVLKKQFNKFMKNGGIGIFDNRESMLFNAYPVFIDNKSPTKTLYLSVCPIFDVTPFENNNHFNPKHYLIQVTDWNVGKRAFTAREASKGHWVAIKKIMSRSERIWYSLWRSGYYGLKDFPLASYMVQEPLGDTFLRIWRHFHRLQRA